MILSRRGDNLKLLKTPLEIGLNNKRVLKSVSGFRP